MIGYSPIGVTPIGTTGAASGQAGAGSVTSDLACSYAVRTAVSSDLAAAYAVRAKVQADLAQAFAVRAQVTRDQLFSYAVLDGGGAPVLTPVLADLACAYSVRAAVTRDQLFSYGVRGPVLRDLLCSYAVLADGSIPRPVTVSASRTARFAANPRVAVFNAARPVALSKGALDELWFVGDFTKELADAATTATSVVPVSAGVVVLEGPALQGVLGVVKLGALDASGANYFTFRVTCANGEQFDRTINLTAVDDRSWTFGKDPDDQRFYALDFAADLALSANTTLAAVGAPVAAGVSALSTPAIQGTQVVIKFGGLATGAGAANSCGLAVTFANGEKIYRSIYFTREDH